MTKEELQNMYDRMKRLSAESFKKKEYKQSLLCLRAAGYIAYTFGFRYCDDEIEHQLANLATKIQAKCVKKTNSRARRRCVLLDGLSEFRGGLTVHYLRAIKEAGWDVLYVSDQNLNQLHRKPLIKELKSNPRLQYTFVPRNRKNFSACQFMYDAIMDFAPDDIIIHIPPYDSYAATVCYALPQTVKKYMVNYTDHSFLLGTGCMDYSFEFRNKGASISKVFRHISESQMIILPYYAFSEDEKPYQGLPEICNNKVVIFSGGNYWKIIDEKDTFFVLAKQILEVCSDAVIVLAGKGSEVVVREAIKRQQPGERFVVLGWRQDIGELFNHCDIYLSTYPHPGGLMGQFAARAGKPILAYDPEYKKGTESLTCQIRQVDISIADLDNFINEAQRLVNDRDYRKRKGEALKTCVLSVDQFNRMFIDAVENRTPTGIPMVFDENVKEPSDEYIQNILKVHDDGRSYKYRMVYYLGTYSLRALPMSYVSTYCKEFALQLLNVFKSKCSQFIS